MKSRGRATFKRVLAATGLLFLWRQSADWRLAQPARNWLRRMLPEQWHYDADFYARRLEMFQRSAQVMAESMSATFAPDSVVDVGCGSGLLLEQFRNRGCTVQGFEYSDAARALASARGISVAPLDLRAPLAWGNRYSLSCCFEVAEHVDARFADTVVASIASLAPVVVFSAAVPGQGGTNHVNEQPNEYWIEKFKTCGFQLDRGLTERFRHEWREAGGVARFYFNNVLVFRAQTTNAG